MYEGKIPFINGVQAHHPSDVRSWRGEEVEWRDNYVFEGELWLENKINTGRSAKYLTVVINSEKYIMFVKDFMEAVIQYGARPGGWMEGKWCFCKRGQNYGVCAHKESK